MIIRKTVLGVLLCATIFLSTLTNAQTSTKPPSSSVPSDQDAQDAVSTFNIIAEKLEKNDWKGIENLFTNAAADEFAYGLTAHLLGNLAALRKFDGQVYVETHESFIEKIEQVVSQHDLVKLAESIEERSFDQDNFTRIAKETVLLRLDRDGKRWEILSALWKAQAGFDLALNIFEGSVEETIIDDGNVLVIAVSEHELENLDGNDEVNIWRIPSVNRMKLVNETWLFDGKDRDRAFELDDKYNAEAIQKEEEEIERMLKELDDEDNDF